MSIYRIEEAPVRTIVDASLSASGGADVSVGDILRAVDLLSAKVMTQGTEGNDLASARSPVRHAFSSRPFRAYATRQTTRERIALSHPVVRTRRRKVFDLTRQKLTADEASELLHGLGVNLTAKTSANRRDAGRSKFEKLHSGAVRHDQQDLIKFASNQRVSAGTNTSKQGPI